MNCPRCGYYLENPNVAACPNCGQPLAASTYGGAPQTPNPYSAPPASPYGTPPSSPYGQPPMPNPYGQPTAPSQPMYPQQPPQGAPMYAPPSQPMYGQQAPYGQQPGMPGMPPGGTPFQPAKRGAGPVLRIVIGIVVVVLVVGGIAVASGLLKGTPLSSNSVYSSSLTGTVSDWPNDSGCSPQDDGFHITAAVVCYPDLDDQSDVTLSVQVKQLTGDLDVAYGVVFRRVSAGNYYLFGIDGNGDNGTGKWIFAKVVDGTPQRLVDFTANAAINGALGQVNTLKIAAKGSHFTFFANGVQLGTGDDSSFAKGKWGLEGFDDIEVVFTNIKIDKTA